MAWLGVGLVGGHGRKKGVFGVVERRKKQGIAGIKFTKEWVWRSLAVI